MSAPAPAGGVTFDIATADASATTADGDYVARSVTGATIAAGDSSYTFSVTVNGDYKLEGDDRVLVNVSNVVGATVADGQGSGTITNDDDVYNVSSLPVTEGNTGSVNQTIFVSSSSRVGYDRTVYLTFTGITATSNVDFDATTRTVVIAAGTNLTAVNLPIYGDYQIEGPETFRANLFLDAALTVPAQSFVNGAYVNASTDATITDNDVAGTLTIGDISIVEGNNGTQNAAVLVSRSGGSGDVSVAFTTADGGGTLASATAGSDYIASTGTLNFRNGSQSQTILIPVIGDTVTEPNEQFSVLLSNTGIAAAQQATIGGTGRGIVTIVNDEGGPGTTPGTGGSTPAPAPGTVTTSGSYTAGRDDQVTVIQTANPNGTEAVNLTGNGYSQSIAGNNGDNIINGGGGNDTLIGYGGNDTFLVRGQGDVVIEGNGGGRDTVFTTGSYNLGVNEIEVLSTVTNSDTTPIDLIGNFATQTIVGNYGTNILNGGSGGLDTLIGLLGDDLYAVGDSGVVVVENGGEGADTVVASVSYTLGAGVSVEVLAAQNRAGTEALTLRGNELAQTVVGNDGANIIDGGAGSDVLVGGGGADRFAFTTALGNGNVDAIVDFAAGTDRIQLSSAIFGAVGTSVTAAGFVTGSAATTADQHIVYNATTGQIFYDADGSGAGAAILFATVAAGTQLSAASFEVAAPVVIA